MAASGPHPTTWAHPWLRLQLAIGTMTATCRGDERPTVKAELRQALALRAPMRRGAWWN